MTKKKIVSYLDVSFEHSNIDWESINCCVILCIIHEIERSSCCHFRKSRLYSFKGRVSIVSRSKNNPLQDVAQLNYTNTLPKDIELQEFINEDQGTKSVCYIITTDTRFR